MGLAKSQEVKVFPSDGSLRVADRTSRRRAELKEALGEWRREFDLSTGALLGYRMISPEERKGEFDLPTTASTPQIAGWEMELNVGRSRTAGLNDLRRMERRRDGGEDEDAVERVQAKVRVFAVIGSARGDVLRVWPR